MDSNDHTESQIPPSTPETDRQYPPYRSPLIVRGLVFAFLIVVVVSIYSGNIFKPAPEAHSFKGEMQQLGLAYHEFHRKQERSPASLEDLQDFIANPPPPPKAEGIVPPDPVTVVTLPDSLEKMIEEDTLVVIWNAVLTDSGQENDKYLLAYTKDITKNGGFALTAAGRVLELTPDEFKAYPLVPVVVDEVEPVETDAKAEEAPQSKSSDAAEEKQPEAEKPPADKE
ncbi:hypothetical protein [Gimesia panareensis]|uniref:hypothetical protein n=1 Tax=Gimesia panareensis TaxID=2527978 RepID=UPI00118CF798|nr:hypothetical protein [Gimesia panareensis]QDU48550.1 hypothetical protein Pan110_08650 [Gimesia panareensis]